MKRTIFSNAYDAIRAGNQCAPCGIAYDRGYKNRQSGWYVYDLKQGIEDITAAKPEFICLGLGKIPVPLSDEGSLIIQEMIAAAA